MSKMIKCKSCSKEMASNAEFCSGCGVKNKKPVYKKPWFIIIAILVVGGAMGGAFSSDSTATDSGKEQEITQDSKVEDNKKEDTNTSPVEKEPVKEEAPAQGNISTEQKSALKKAKSYSNTMHMSKAGLYDQLTSEYGEKFTAEAAQYAIDNVDADWKANALKKAESYQEMMAMSPSAIYDQLISEAGEQFTAEEAQYAIDNLK